MKALRIILILILSLVLLGGLYLSFTFYHKGNGYGIRYFQAKNSEILSTTISSKLMDHGNGRVGTGLVLNVVVKVNSPLILKDVKNGNPLKIKPSFVDVITPDGSRHTPFFPIGTMYIEKVSEGVYSFTEEQLCTINIFSQEYCQSWAEKMTNPKNHYKVGLSYFGRFLRAYVLNVDM